MSNIRDLLYKKGPEKEREDTNVFLGRGKIKDAFNTSIRWLVQQ